MAYTEKLQQKHEVLADLIAKDNMTISQIVKSDFIAASFKSRGWEMPKCPTTVTKIIVEQAEHEKKKMSAQFKELIAKKCMFSVTIDEWTSIANKRFMAVALIFNCGLFNLGMASITGSSNSANLLATLEAKLVDYELGLENCIAIITDGSAVMKKMHRETDKIGQLCLNHGIHLCVKDSIANSEYVLESETDDVDDSADVFNKSFKSSIQRMKKIISIFNHSAHMQEKLDNARTAEHKQPHTLLPIIDIRWNSTFLSVKRFLEMLPEIEAVITAENANRSPVIF